MQKKCFNCPVEVVRDAFGDSPELAGILKKATGADKPKVLIVADLNVVQRTEGLGTRIGRYVNAHGIELAGSPVVLAGGEKVKSDNFQSAIRIGEAILAARIGRNDAVLALGGGTILDVAGYAAAQARGGVPVVRMPTTPAAMLGGAYADYAAVNANTIKDALRVPSAPAAVVIDPGFAVSVLDGVWRGGFGEALRLALAADASLVRKLGKLAEGYRNRDQAALEEMVLAVRTLRAKKGDGNFGRWAAARLEAMSGYKLPYGYAVAIGLCIELGYADARGRLKSGEYEDVCATLRACGALDGMAHSRHLLEQTDSLMLGLDAWALSAGSAEVPVLDGIGKVKIDPEPDGESFRAAIKRLVAPSANP